MRDHVCAVDVGTTSARTGIFDGNGRLLARAESPFPLSRIGPDTAEYRSEAIWRAVAAATRAALMDAGLPAGSVAAIGFGATCSLVVRTGDGSPIDISSDGTARDTIAWCDHRALAEAEACTATGHAVLAHLGGVMSPEMQPPKLMWLKANRQNVWGRAGLIFDLADFLTWRATGSRRRSVCTLTSKWTYLAHDKGWQADFLEAVGLDDLAARTGIDGAPADVGERLGRLSPDAADDLGLDTECVVSAGLVDAYAGALGVLGGLPEAQLETDAALIGGTSSCVMTLSRRPRASHGAWGPFRGAVLPDYWVTEGGQSAAGSLLDYVISTFGGEASPDAESHRRVIDRIAVPRRIEGAAFGAGIHVLPDIHGNRAPFADPHARGVFSGLTLDCSFDNLCRVYWRTAVSLALGVRHIVERLNDDGSRIGALHIAGGHRNNPVLMDIYASATGLSLCEPETDDAVLLGSAMAAATAAGLHESLQAACSAMRSPVRIHAPDPAAASGFERDYRIFLTMHDQKQALDRLMRACPDD